MSAARLVAVAAGRAAADLVITNCQWVNVHSREVLANSQIAIADGRFAYCGPDASHCIGPQTEILEIIFRGKNVEEETKSYEDKFANPLKAAERGYVDDVIVPSETRARIVNALKVSEGKTRPAFKRHHDNQPL